MPARFSPVRYRVVLEQDEDGVFVAEAPSLPGCVSQGRTRSEALANIRDAIAGYVGSLEQRGEPVPPGPEEEFVDVP
jgi:predicted RNase H-like HicB family nuclease